MTDIPRQPIAILGIPFDEKSSYLRGAAQAPAAIREAFHCPSSNYFSELGVDFQQHPDILHAGDLTLQGDTLTQFDQITNAVNSHITAGQRVLALGGDHSITYPLVRAAAGQFPRLTILHFDAHGDLYDQLDGDPLSHACPFARIMEAGLAQRLVQVGIRTLNRHQREQVARFGVECTEMKDFQPRCLPPLSGDVYLSFDMDALDPAFAPGVSHYEPGGLTTREAIDLIHSLAAMPIHIIGADLVELNPVRDIHGMTAMTAAKLMKEIASVMLVK